MNCERFRVAKNQVLKLFGYTCNIEYTVPGMTHFLKANGFSHKRPAIVPGKANLQAQKEWIEKYEKLKEALPQDDAICFIDGVHPTHNTKTAYGWIKKGDRKEIPTNTGRQRLNISGAMDINSRKVISQEDITLNAQATISFLKKLETSYPMAKQIHVFCDNARYYKNKEVSQFLKNSKIEMHFLPPYIPLIFQKLVFPFISISIFSSLCIAPISWIGGCFEGVKSRALILAKLQLLKHEGYSPNLNPIERLWKLMNEHVLYNRYYEKFTGFKSAVFGFLESLANPEEGLLSILKSRITDNFRVMGSSLHV